MITRLYTFPGKARLAAWLAGTTLLCLAAPRLHATLIWSADTTRGTANFENLDIDETGGTITVASDPLGQYGNVFKYYLPDEPSGFGKERTESKGTVTPSGNYQLQNNTDYYIGWRSMWNPMPSNPGWVALFQIHGYGPSGQPAPLVFRLLGDGNLSAQNGVTGGNNDFWHVPFKLNTWQNFVVHINLSSSASVGYVEIWYNGVNQTLAGGVSVGGVSRLYCQTVDPTSGSYDALKWGVYRSGAMDGTGPATAYMSGAKLGTTYADVDPTGGGGGGNFSGIFQIQNEASGLVLNNQGSLTNGSPITQWSSTSSSNLDWTFIPTSGGYYQINSSKSGKDAVVQSASTSAGAKIVQWSFGSSGNDQWKPNSNSDGSYTFINLHSGLVLGDPGSSTSTSTQMDQETSNGGSNQKWKLLKQ